MKIYNAKIYGQSGTHNGFIEIKDGVIAVVGKGKPAETAEEDYNAKGYNVYPGFIDAHSHLGIFGDSVGFESCDANETSESVTPHLRAIDSVNPMDRCFSETVQAGITTAVTGAGSANPIGGEILAMHTYGSKVIDNLVIKTPLAIKFALGENPKSVHHERDESPVTRMATAGLIRESLFKAKRYLEDWEACDSSDGGEESKPDFDIKSEALLPLLKREIQAHFHCHRADDIFTAIRITKEFNLDTVLIHATDAHLVADELAKENIPCILGPLMCDRSKPELANSDTTAPAVLHKAGVKFAISSDHPVIPAKYLLHSLMVAVKSGLPKEAAIETITKNAAEICRLDRLGEIKEGNIADLVIFRNVFDLTENPAAVFVGGKLVERNQRD